MVTLGGSGGFDMVLIEFIQGNVFTIGLVLGILKILAKETKWAGDDKVISFLSGVFTSAKSQIAKEKPLPTKEDRKDA